ncbi:MAG TPA: glycosyltransferase family 2 protein [Pyrinomonadaceae bacterium]|nr:glycosyltransferase family 2 protein [Pyrinomonadaceae bacterium]
MSVPKLSVIIPTYNRAALLPEAIKSVRRAGTDLEIIVVDNASTDDTPQLCGKLEGVRYLRLGRNTGEAGARNAGIRESRSEYVAFLDDDDLRQPGSLDVQFEVLAANRQVALVYGRVLIGDAQNCIPTGESYPASCPVGDIFWSLLADNFIPMPSVVARKQRLIEVGLFDARMTPVRDWDLWLRVAEKFEVAAVEEPVAIYRKWNLSSNQMSSDRAGLYRAAAAVQARALRLPRASAAASSTRRQIRRGFLNRMSDGLIYEAVAALEAGYKRAAWANAITAVRLRPLRVMRSRLLRNLCADALRNAVRRATLASRA